MALSPYSTAAQRGESYSNLRSPQEAQSFLSGAEVSDYNAAIRGLGAEPIRKKSGKIKAEKDFRARSASMVDKVSRLRDIASTRALSEYEDFTSQLSKPWRVADAPLISELIAKDPLSTGGTRTFGSMDIAAGKKMRDTLKSMTMGGEGGSVGPRLLDPKLLGNPYQQSINRNAIAAMAEGDRTLRGRIASGKQSAIGGIGAGGSAAYAARYRRMRENLARARTTADVTNPELAYLGKGGFSRAPDFGY